jgi:hypothetical protein
MDGYVVFQGHVDDPLFQLIRDELYELRGEGRLLHAVLRLSQAAVEALAIFVYPARFLCNRSPSSFAIEGLAI